MRERVLQPASSADPEYVSEQYIVRLRSIAGRVGRKLRPAANRPSNHALADAIRSKCTLLYHLVARLWDMHGSRGILRERLLDHFLIGDAE